MHRTVNSDQPEADDLYKSSDSVRTAAPLKYAQKVTFSGPVQLELGGTLPEVTVTYETYGQLNAARDNAILICHAISGDSHVARHNESDVPGWWDIVVGPGKAIDTNRYFIICPNILGGCRGTTGPNCINPETGQPYGADFPTITVADIVDVQKKLIEHLGLERLLAVVGGSMGGHQVLCWATRHAQMIRGAIPIATSPRLTAQGVAFDVVGRNAILRDPDFHGGQYYGKGAPKVGLAIARMLGHITYLSRESMREKFGPNRLAPRDVPTEFEKKFSVGSYLAYQGSRFVERFDANSYIRLSMAMDLFDLGDTQEELTQNLAKSLCRYLVVSFTSDWLFPPDQSEEIVRALISAGKEVSYCNVASTCGHDAFLLEDDLERYGELIRAFLASLHGEPVLMNNGEDDPYGTSATSIFHRKRLDYDRIGELVQPGASVLDLGCGRGHLLIRLKERGHSRLMGVELDEQGVIASVQRGLNVVQADLNRGLPGFTNGQFDVVILSQTLQAIRDVQGVLNEMLRVGRRCIVSFPNFAYYKLRRMLADEGHAPVSPGLLHFKWYDSPNIRFFSIADFEDFCHEKNIRIHDLVALDTEEQKVVIEDPNLYADMAIFVISR